MEGNTLVLRRVVKRLQRVVQRLQRVVQQLRSIAHRLQRVVQRLHCVVQRLQLFLNQCIFEYPHLNGLPCKFHYTQRLAIEEIQSSSYQPPTQKLFRITIISYLWTGLDNSVVPTCLGLVIMNVHELTKVTSLTQIIFLH